MPRARAVRPDSSSAELTPSHLRRLVSAARRVRRHAYAPYSKFAVGAAVLAADGSIYAGCNVENGSYGATLCAERGALAAAVAGGAARLLAVAVVTGAEPPSPPCGICLQSLVEFVRPDAPVVLAGVSGGPLRTMIPLGNLAPRAFRLRPSGPRRRR